MCVPASKATAAECLESMASGLYSEVFTLLVSLINRWAIGGHHGAFNIDKMLIQVSLDLSSEL